MRWALDGIVVAQPHVGARGEAVGLVGVARVGERDQRFAGQVAHHGRGRRLDVGGHSGLPQGLATSGSGSISASTRGRSTLFSSWTWR